jgi:hypothetical protein
MGKNKFFASLKSLKKRKKTLGSGTLIVNISLFRYLQNSGENHTSQPRGSRWVDSFSYRSIED